MKTIHYESPCTGNMGDWKGRHRRSVDSAIRLRITGTQEGAIAWAIKAWCDYATAHKDRFESEIGQDYILGPAWRDWGLALRTLLNGETGLLDSGTLDTILVDNLHEQGYGDSL